MVPLSLIATAELFVNSTNRRAHEGWSSLSQPIITSFIGKLPRTNIQVMGSSLRRQRLSAS
jgi:hypothetical protein